MSVGSASAEEIPLPPGFRRVDWPGGQSTQAGSKHIIFAVDNLLQRSVVIAALRAPDDSEQRGLALAEAQRLALVCDHPNIITIHSATLAGDWLLLVNQYAPGGDLRRLLGSGPMTLARAVRLARQIADALHHAHQHQIVHRDLKPENVLLNEMFDAQLADFGIAVRADAAVIHGETVGTPGYMAPEQIRGTGSAAGDLYSFGCVLFELLTQRPVFHSSNSFELMRRHLSDVPEAPARINPRVPALLSDLCLQLLAKAPEQRPATAAAVAERLAQFQSDARSVAPRRPAPGAVAHVHEAPRLLGRDAEMADFGQRLDALQALGRGGVVLIEGPPGAGKSRLAEALEPLAQAVNATLLLGRGLEGVKLPFLPFIEALRPLRGALTSDGAGDRLQGLLAGAGTATRGAGAADVSRETLLIELDDALRVVAMQRPLVLVIDDLHWADESSLALFQQLAVALAAAPMALPILLVGTLRPVLDEAPAQRGVVRLLQRLQRYPAVRHLPLPPLEVGDVRTLVEALTGSRCSARLAARIADLTLGNPLHTRELVAHLARRELLQMRGGFLVGTAAANDLDLPQSLAGLVAERLQELTDSTRRVLSVAACMAGEWSLEQLAELLHETPRATFAALDEAEQGGFVRGQQHRYVFLHPLMRAAFYSRLSDSSRRIWHFDIAQQLTRVTAPEQRKQRELAIGQHLLLAGEVAPLDMRLTALVRAVDCAYEQFAWDQAASFAGAALALGTGQPPAWIARLQQLAGDALHQAGEPRAGLKHWLAAAQYYRQQGDVERLAAVLTDMYRAAHNFGFLDQLQDWQPRHLEDAAARAAVAAPHVGAEAFDVLCTLALAEGRLDAAEEYLNRGLQLLGDANAERITRSRMGSTAFVLALRRSDARAAEAALHVALADAEAVDHAPTIARSRQRLPVAQLLLGNLPEAARNAALGLTNSRVIATTGEHGITYSALAAVHVLRGEFQLAVDAGEAALELLCTTSYSQAAAHSLPVLIAAYAHQGQFADARRVARLMTDSSGVIDPPLPFAALRAEHELLLDALEHGGAGVTVRTRAVPERPIDFLRLSRYGIALEAHSLGAACDGVEHCVAAFTLALRNQIAFTLGWTGYVPRWLAVARLRARGDPAEAVLLLDACRRQAEVVDARFEVARCLLDLAVAHIAAGQPALARAARDAAIARFDAMHAAAWVVAAERLTGDVQA